MLKCPHCEADYIPGALYCDACGHHLPPLHIWPPRSDEPDAEPDEAAGSHDETEAAAPDEEQVQQPPHLRLQLLSGSIIDLGGREQITIGRRDPQYAPPDVDLAPYGGVEHGVSRLHAIISFQDGKYSIEDLKSYNDTLLNASRLFPHQQYPLHDGDLLQFGTLVVRVLL